jgi:glutaconate CoA-transferase subunit B
MANATDFTLAELIVVAAAEAWRHDGELLATGIGPLPRLAVGLAKLSFAPGLFITDGEAAAVEDPVPLGPRGNYVPRFSGWMPYGRVFDSVWSGKRHAMVTPVQMDRYGQMNLSALGDFRRPKVQLLGVRGFPGNSVNHKNSMFLPNHSKRTFLEGEVDVVSSVGTNPARWPEGAKRPEGLLGIVVTDLCVFDFEGHGRTARILSLHPGVTVEQVQAATGFAILPAEEMGTTTVPTEEQLTIIRRVDPHDVRATVLKGNPPGRRLAA